MPGKRKPLNKSRGWPEKNGGARRNRTDDLYNAIVALSQLSYGPTLFLAWFGGFEFKATSAMGAPTPSCLLQRAGHYECDP